MLLGLVTVLPELHLLPLFVSDAPMYPILLGTVLVSLVVVVAAVQVVEWMAALSHYRMNVTTGVKVNVLLGHAQAHDDVLGSKSGTTGIYIQHMNMTMVPTAGVVAVPCP